jgi:hypothetical protein
MRVIVIRMSYALGLKQGFVSENESGGLKQGEHFWKIFTKGTLYNCSKCTCMQEVNLQYIKHIYILFCRIPHTEMYL